MYEIGLGKWFSMSVKEQEDYKLWAERQRAKDLEAMTHEEAVEKFKYTMLMAQAFPAFQELQEDKPRGLGLVVDRNARRATPPTDE